jgi:LmbE family N-acetylglucosaminyl deacetylase
MAHVFLSPHFDDAIFSCGGTIHKLIANNQEVIIVTVMGGDAITQPLSPLVSELHARWQAGTNPIAIRKEEDQRASHSLGARLIQLSVPDCIYRIVNGKHLYPSEDSLWGEIHPQDTLTRWLPHHPLTAEFMAKVQTLYAPLGVGQHVDHRLVRDWALELHQVYPQTALQLYTDFPYMKDSSKINHALKNVTVVVQPHWVYLNDQDIYAKVGAIAHYESQISTFWSDTDDMRRDVEMSFRVQAELWGERYWVV